jgi:hypothetical protein
MCGVGVLVQRVGDSLRAPFGEPLGERGRFTRGEEVLARAVEPLTRPFARPLIEGFVARWITSDGKSCSASSMV